MARLRKQAWRKKRYSVLGSSQCCGSDSRGSGTFWPPGSLSEQNMDKNHQKNTFIIFSKRIFIIKKCNMAIFCWNPFIKLITKKNNFFILSLVKAGPRILKTRIRCKIVWIRILDPPLLWVTFWARSLSNSKIKI